MRPTHPTLAQARLAEHLDLLQDSFDTPRERQAAENLIHRGQTLAEHGQIMAEACEPGDEKFSRAVCHINEGQLAEQFGRTVLRLANREA